MIWFLPQTTLDVQANTSYRLRVTTGVKDLANNALTAETVVNFSTANQPDAPALGLWATPDSGDNPRGAAVTPDGALALSTDYWGNRLYLIETSTWQSTSLDLGGKVSDITVTPDGTLAYVLRPANDMVMVVDLVSRSVIDIDPVASGLQGIAVGDYPFTLLSHPTLPLLYVVNYSSEDVSVIDTNTQQESGRWAVNNPTPRGMAISPNGQHLYVTSPHRLSVFDANTGQEVKVFDGLPCWGEYGVVVTQDGNQVWYACESTDELIAIDLRINEVVARVPVGDFPTWLALSPDGETIYVNNQRDGTVSLVQWRTSAILNTLSYPGELFDLAISPTGDKLYVTSDVADSLLVYKYANPADETGPQTTSIRPAHESQNVSVMEPLVVEFNEALDRASVNASTLRVVEGMTRARSAEELAEATMSGQYHFSTDNRTVTFVPAQPWASNTTYTVYQEGGLTDLAGNPLTTQQSSHFTSAQVLNPLPLSPRDEIFAADEVWGLALSPDGTQLALSNRYWNTVSIIDPANLSILHTISVANRPMAVAFNSDGSRLYVVHDADDSRVEIDMATQQILPLRGSLMAKKS
jgi:YVTN family beta-propeller protein